NLECDAALANDRRELRWGPAGQRRETKQRRLPLCLDRRDLRRALLAQRRNLRDGESALKPGVVTARGQRQRSVEQLDDLARDAQLCRARGGIGIGTRS